MGLLCPVSGDGLRLREPVDGGRGHLLLLRAQGRAPHAGARRLLQRPRRWPTAARCRSSSRRSWCGPSASTSASGRSRHELQPGKYALTDFDFEKPSVNLQVKSAIKREHALGRVRDLRLPGDYLSAATGDSTPGPGSRRCRRSSRGSGRDQCAGPGDRLSVHADRHIRATTRTPNISSSRLSMRFKSTEYEDDAAAAARDTAAVFGAQQPAAVSGRTASAKPMVQGPQTAIVVGRRGEDIHTDKFGRVKVHFHWDRYGKSDDKSSCWIRVSQNWGGKGWGGDVHPARRPGSDRPVPGGRSGPALDHRAGLQRREHAAGGAAGGKTQSVIRDHGANEIIMEGDGGQTADHDVLSTCDDKIQYGGTQFTPLRVFLLDRRSLGRAGQGEQRNHHRRDKKKEVVKDNQVLLLSRQSVHRAKRQLRVLFTGRLYLPGERQAGYTQPTVTTSRKCSSGTPLSSWVSTRTCICHSRIC